MITVARFLGKTRKMESRVFSHIKSQWRVERENKYKDYSICHAWRLEVTLER